MDMERSTYQKVLLCLLAAMAVLFAVLTAVSRTHEGVAFRDELLTIGEEGSQTVYSGTLYGDSITIICREENGTKLVDFDAPGHYTAHCRVEFPEGTITTEYGDAVPRIRILRNDEVLFSGGYDPTADDHLRYFSEDGTFTIEPSISIYTSGGDPWYHFELSVYDIMCFAMGPETSVRGSWAGYFIALLLTVIGALLTAFPETVFYLSHCLSVQDPEPTDFFYFTHKLGSILFAAIVLFLYCNGVLAIV